MCCSTIAVRIVGRAIKTWGWRSAYTRTTLLGLTITRSPSRAWPLSNAVLDRLLSSVPVTLPNTPRTQMPLLQEAELVLLSGDSAGANGARVHADRLAEKLRNANTNLGSTLPVLLTLDAGGAPLFNGGVLPWNGTGTGLFPSYQDWMDMSARNARAFSGTKLSNLDRSCVALPGGDWDSCYDHRHVQRNHITTPIFQRNDLHDPVATGAIQSVGLLAAPPPLHSVSPMRARPRRICLVSCLRGSRRGMTSRCLARFARNTSRS